MRETQRAPCVPGTGFSGDMESPSWPLLGLLRMRSHALPAGLDLRTVVLGRQHLLLGASGPAAFLPTGLGDALRLFAPTPGPLGGWRSTTQVETLLVRWPPGPEDRRNRSSRSPSLTPSRRMRSARASCFVTDTGGVNNN